MDLPGKDAQDISYVEKQIGLTKLKDQRLWNKANKNPRLRNTSLNKDAHLKKIEKASVMCTTNINPMA